MWSKGLCCYSQAVGLLTSFLGLAPMASCTAEWMDPGSPTAAGEAQAAAPPGCSVLLETALWAGEVHFPALGTQTLEIRVQLSRGHPLWHRVISLAALCCISQPGEHSPSSSSLLALQPAFPRGWVAPLPPCGAGMPRAWSW